MMNIEELRDYCLVKIGAEESLPFGPDVLVFKVCGKIFALCSLNSEELKVNLKCDPTYALELRERYLGVEPGYHMNKKHWNTVSFESDIPSAKCRHLINHSYELVRSKLTKKQRIFLNNLEAEG